MDGLQEDEDEDEFVDSLVEVESFWFDTVKPEIGISIDCHCIVELAEFPRFSVFAIAVVVVVVAVAVAVELTRLSLCACDPFGPRLWRFPVPEWPMNLSV